MILAANSDAPAYRGIHPLLDAALERIAKEDFGDIGYTTLEISDRDLYATRFTYGTLPSEETFFEAHRRYLDIHIMVDGSERVEIAPPDSLIRFEAVEANDFYAYRGEGRYKLTLSPGDFLVVFPGDAHKIKMRTGAPATVTKVVFKVRIR